MKMKNKFSFIIIALMLIVSAQNGLFGQSALSRPRQLNDVLNSGDLTLSVTGNGAISGSSVQGSLINNTSFRIRVNAALNGGIYLINSSGGSQNMIATQVLLLDGSYYTETGLVKYVELPPKATIKIIFSAYSADYGKTIPTSKESFSNSSMPPALQSIATKISKYDNDNFDDDLVMPIQIALWRALGVSRTDIAKKFAFTNADWDTASLILNY
jgi:hypothetical protein